jgi:hypothetical protein
MNLFYAKIIDVKYRQSEELLYTDIDERVLVKDSRIFSKFKCYS